VVTKVHAPTSFSKPYQGDLSGIFVIVPARDSDGVLRKHVELRKLGLRHLIVCGQRSTVKDSIYRTPRGKYDAINVGLQHLPKRTAIVVLNDVDTRIVNFEKGLVHFGNPDVGLVITSVELPIGAHSTFNRLIDAIRQHFIIAANGELMFFRRQIFDMIGKVKPCKAEDTLLMFEALRLGYRVVFESNCHTITSRTSTSSLKNEEIFKRKVVCGIYQAIYLADAPIMVKLFYGLLPFASILLLAVGKKGMYWVRGILLGLTDFLKGDRSGYWLPTYKK